MVDVITGNDQLGATKEQKIAALVQRELQAKSILAKYFLDVSEFAVEGAKSISFPKLGSFTATNRAEGTKGETTTITATLDTMLLDQNAYIAYIIDSMTKKQNNIKAELRYAERAASAHARYFDNAIIAKIRAVCSFFSNAGADANVVYTDLTELQEKYLAAEGILAEGVWLMSTTQNKAICEMDEFKNLAGFGETVMRDGFASRILGMPVVIHNGLAGKELFLCGKDGLAYGFQSGPAMDEQPANEYGVGARRAAVDQLFGVQGLHLEEKGAAAGKSPLILGLND